MSWHHHNTPQSLPSKQLSLHSQRENVGLGVRKDSVSGNRFMSSRDGKCWVLRPEVPFPRKSVGNGDSPLGGQLNSFLDSISIDQTKIKPEFFIIRFVIVDNMFVCPKTCWLALILGKGSLVVMSHPRY